MKGLYIEMCEKAEEIQWLWKPEVGDRVAIIFEGDNYIIATINEKFLHDWFAFPKNKEIKIIWLPREKELRKKCHWQYDFSILCPYAIEEYLAGFAKKIFPKKGFSNWEVFWLLLYMYQKYHKVWDEEKEEWVEKEV